MLRIKEKRCYVTVLAHDWRPITIGLYYSFQCSRVSSRNNWANITYFCVKQKSSYLSIPCELGGESCSSNVDEGLALFEHEETCQDIFPYNFDIALLRY